LALTVTFGAGRGELPLAGVFSCGVALLAITFGTLYQKHFVSGVDLRVGACIQFLVTALAFLGLAAAFDSGNVTWHPRFVFALLWLCLVLSLGAISLLWILIARGAVSRVASLFYLVPPVTAVEGYLLFGETLALSQWLGIALTAGGVVLVNRS
jgi:drug/metabolite transporter (DMT)-like permease